MVTLGSKRIHMAFMDSRGLDLDQRISKINTTNKHLEINAYYGATFEDLVGYAERYLHGHEFDVVYIAGGACNITTKNRETKSITYNWGTGDSLGTYLTKSIMAADKAFSVNFPASRVVFCPLVGSDLARVVTDQIIKSEEQLTVDNAIWEFNWLCFDINSRRGVFSPSLHHQVHRNARSTNYELFLL